MARHRPTLFLVVKRTGVQLLLVRARHWGSAYENPIKKCGGRVYQSLSGACLLACALGARLRRNRSPNGPACFCGYRMQQIATHPRQMIVNKFRQKIVIRAKRLHKLKCGRFSVVGLILKGRSSKKYEFVCLTHAGPRSR
jgi:hypothetical protein